MSNKSQVIQSRLPSDWISAITEDADRLGVTVSAWLRDACREKLPTRQAKALSKPQTPGRPQKQD